MLANRKQLLFMLLAFFVTSSGQAQNSFYRAVAVPVWDSIKAEMFSCTVCKNIVADWFKHIPEMRQEVLRFEHGFEFVQSFKDSADFEHFKKKAKLRSKAFKAAVAVTNSQTEKRLCGLCLELRKLVKTGVQVNWNFKKDSIVMTVNSTNPALVYAIYTLLKAFPQRFGIAWAGYYNSLDTIDEEPILVKRIEPEYPRLAREFQLEGTVVFEVLVDENGRVENVRIMKSNNEIFNEATISAAKQWDFRPGFLNGKPVKRKLISVVVFKMQ